jgi:hypothetical protein
VLDVEDTFRRWLERIDARYVLIRPDFYVALTAKTPDGLRQRFARIVEGLHLSRARDIAAE